jgi:phospholipase D1/2
MDTASRDTGQYFCNLRPFSLPRQGNQVTLLENGRMALEAIHKAITEAKSFVWIADWQMAYDVELVERGSPEFPGRLHAVIENIIKDKPIQFRVLLYKSPTDAVGTFDDLVAEQINGLNKPGYKGSVLALQQGATSDQGDGWDYSHHQKFVVVDGEVAFIGGIDLSYGRWETGNFDVVIDPKNFTINEMYNPCVPKLRGINSDERRKMEQFNFAAPYGGKLLDEGRQPRMPWQDVHVQLHGPSVVDIHRNFVRRWNMGENGLDRIMHLFSKGPHKINKKWLTEIGAWDLLAQSQTQKRGTAEIQIVRSVSNEQLENESDSPDDLELFKDQRAIGVWKNCLAGWKDQHQNNILNAMVNCIRSADNYIYIETQFFISGFGDWSGENGAKSFEAKDMGNEGNGIQNTIAIELAKRIQDHIEAQTPFHVYLVLPVHPEGDINTPAVWKQHLLALATLQNGGDSLIKRIQRALEANGRDASQWTQYLTVLNMRNYGVTVEYERDPVTNDEKFEREIGRYLVTEQIYIHSKLMIVDDAVAIIGSANTNDRSLTGNGDTEIAAVIVDTADCKLENLGSPTLPVQTRGFARNLRRQLWSKHFGFDVGKVPYFGSFQRADPDAKDPTIHPPRDSTNPVLIKDAGQEFSEVLDKPCDPKTIATIQAIARNNLALYEQVFTGLPSNQQQSFKPEDGYLTFIANKIESTWDDWTGEKKRQDRSLLKSYLPPALQRKFMTTPQNRSETTQAHLYPEGTIHNVVPATNFLKKNIVGFFVAAPLDWGKKTKTNGDPSRLRVEGVDLAENTRRPTGTLKS